MEQFFAKAVYAKTGLLRYTSHRDIIEIIKKAVVRSGIPVVYSQGFNPHPSLSFFNPLQLGIESVCEICVIPLSRYLRPDDIQARLNRMVPAGMEFREVIFIRSRKDVTVVSSRFQLALPPGAGAGVRARLEEVVRPDFAITKDRNQKQITVGDRIANCQVTDTDFLFTLLSTGGSSISPLEFLKLFFPLETAVEALFRLKRKSVVVR